MNYCELKKKTNTGWNTWNTLNVLSYSHLPEGFTINLCITEYSDTKVLRESLIGRGGQFDEKIFPGARTYDGSCTQLKKLIYFMRRQRQNSIWKTPLLASIPKLTPQ